MRKASLILFVIGSLPLNLSGQADTEHSPSPLHVLDAQMIREKYESIQVETFEVKPGVEFPSEYLAKAHEEMFKQLSDAKIVKEILRSGDARKDESAPIILLSGTINNYTPGSRPKRYVGLGLGAAEVDAEIFLLDGRTKQRLQTERLRAVLTGGLFGGSEDKIANELARRVVLQTRYMLNGRIPTESLGTTSRDAPPAVAAHDQQ